MAGFCRFLRATALATLIAPPLAAQTDPQPSLMEFFSVNRIGTFIANSAIAALRTQMELEYEYLSTDLMRGSVSISGVTVRPLLPYDQAQQCVITIERAVLNTDVAKPFEVASEMNLNLIGTRASTACVPRDVAMGLRAAGIRDIELDQFKIRGAYVYATGETSADVTLAINDFATIDASASAMILPRMGDFGPGDPAFRVMRAVVSLKDQGGWEKVSAVLPPNFNDPQTIKEIGTEAVTQFMSNGGTRAVSAVERNFIADLMDRVEEFVTDPGEITIEAALPDTGIVIEPETYDREPFALVSALALEARTSPIARSRIIDSAKLAALANGENSTPEDLLEIAEALLNGIGVPQAPTLVPRILTGLTAEPEYAAAASALIAQALQDSDPSGAYVYALVAASDGVDGAVSRLDRLENRMTTGEVLTLQAAEVDRVGIVPADAIADIDDPRALRALALAHYAGAGQSRSYARAYYYALLAEAAGDIGATALKNEIESRFSARGDEVTEAWAELSASIQASALEDWIAGGLADRFRTE